MMTKGNFTAIIMLSVGFGGLMVFGGSGRYGIFGDPPAQYLFGLGSGATWLGFLASLVAIVVGGLKLREYIFS
jgi:hypothetical protein